MSVQSEIDRINGNVAETYSVLAEAGADTPAAANTDNLAETAASIKAVLYNKTQSLTDTQKAQARENINAVGKSSLTLGVHTDGLVYIFIDGAPVGTGVEMEVVGDVVGYIDADNNIVLTGDLAEGTYTVKYETSDGELLEIGELNFAAGGYTNLVPTSISADGSVFNGVGYQDGVRANSSGTTSALDGATTTGWIPIDLAKDVIRVKGVDRTSAVGDANYAYLTFAKEDFEAIAFAKPGSRQNLTIGYKNSGWPTMDANGVELLYSPDNTGSIDMDSNQSDYEIVRTDIKYFRLTGKGNGADLIVTKNEEIV